MAKEVNILALVKGGERYIFLFDDNHRAECLRTLGRFASHQELSFTWYDAAVLSHKIRQTAQSETASPRSRFQLPHAQQDDLPQTPDDLVG